MKKDFLIFLCALSALFFIPVRTHATDYTIEPKADGADAIKSRAIPLFYNTGSTWGSATQQIYLASELSGAGAGAGDINAITFYYSASSTIYSNPSARNIQIFLMEIPAEQNAFAIKAANAKSDFLYVSSTNKTAGTKVFEGALNTEAVTSSQTKTVKINFDNSFSWDGSSNLVLTVFDMSATSNTVNAGGFANIRFLISKTSTPRFLCWKWFSSDEDNRTAWIADLSNNLAGREGEYWSTPTTVEGQTTNRSYVNKVDFSISPAAVVIPAPTNLAANDITSSSATLSWDAVASATGYNVRWGKTSGSLDHNQNNVTSTSLPISGLDDGETYFFDVQTVTAGGTSAWASEASFNTVAVAHEHNGISFSKWASNNSFPTSGNYYLNSDVALGWSDADVTLSGNLNLCLNGHTANLAFFRIIVPNGVTFTLFDNVGGGKITSFFAGSTGEMISEGLITVNNGGTLILGEGAIENTYVTDEDGVSIAICSQGTLKLSGAPSISSNDIDIYLGNNSNITIESGKPLTNSTPFKVSRLLSGKFTSGWTNMSGADPSDHFVSAKAGHGIGLSESEAAFLAVLALDENSSSNESTLSPEVGQTHNVAITRSTLTSSQFNTFCLPFALSNAQLEEIFGAGYDLEEFVSSEIVGEELVLTFNQVDALVAGKPYLIQPSINVTNPSFEGVTISAAAPVDQEDDTYISFHGVFNPIELTGGNKNLLFLGAGNELFWPAATGNLKGFRAYFEVKGAAQKAKAARIVKKEDQSQAIENVENPDRAQKRIINGQLIIEKNGRFYNAQGQIVK